MLPEPVASPSAGTDTVPLAAGPLTRSAKRRLESEATKALAMEPRGNMETEAGVVAADIPPPGVMTPVSGPPPKKARITQRAVAGRKGAVVPALPHVRESERGRAGRKLVVQPEMVAVRSRDEGDDADGGELPAHEQSLQLTDDMIEAAQTHSKLVQKLLAAERWRDRPVNKTFGLVTIETKRGRRVLMPPELWPLVFKEMHGSVWAGHLRGPHTYGRVAQLYWWPNLRREVARWVRGCQECGSRKARPREIIPPLRSLRGGDIGDRWALDVAGPFPVADGGERYVIAALEYVTRYAVARCVVQHTAESVATFLMEEVVLKFGVFRELLTDGAPELTGKAIELLVTMLQARQTNPVPYRPQMVGLVERFHRTWKDVVATFMTEEKQDDWNLWVRFAVYAYNSAVHSTVALTPNELMMGRRLRQPNELLRRAEVAEAGALPAYHERLLQAMEKSCACAERGRRKEQARQAKYYNRGARQKRTFAIGDHVWVYHPPRGQNATKFGHRWMGPMRVVEDAGYENYLLEREDKQGARETVIAHASFLASYHYPVPLLARAAADIDEELSYESDDEVPFHGQAHAAPVRAATAGDHRSAATGAPGRCRSPPRGAVGIDDASGNLVEVRRRQRRNRAGQYVLEYELVDERGARGKAVSDGRDTAGHDGPAGRDSRHAARRPATGRTGIDGRRWVSVAEYERILAAGRVVEDPM
jgi:hypothetical protein